MCYLVTKVGAKTYKTVPIINQMKRLLVAMKAFRLIIVSKNISVKLKYEKKGEIVFEKGC
jgi:hypothetical protein